MKKNLRIVSAAAAALLAVAPVAASAVSTVNAETPATTASATNSNQSYSHIDLGNVHVTNNDLVDVTPSLALTGAVLNSKNEVIAPGNLTGSITATLGSVSATGNLLNGDNGKSIVTIKDGSTTVYSSNMDAAAKANGLKALRAGTSYTVEITNIGFNFGANNAGKKITLKSSNSNVKLTKTGVTNNADGSLPVQLDQNGAVKEINATYTVKALDSTNTNDVVFYDVATGQPVTAGNVDVVANVSGQLNVSALLPAVRSSYIAVQKNLTANDATNGGRNDVPFVQDYPIVAASDIAAQLKAQDITVNNDGSFNAKHSFTLKVKATSEGHNTSNGKSHEMTVTFTTTNVADPVVPSVNKTVMHNAYFYDKNAKRVGTDKLTRYNSVTVSPKTTTINGVAYYEVVENNKLSGKFINADNIDGTKRTLKHNAYVYRSSKKRANKLVLKKGETVTTYGGSYTFKNGKKYYKIGNDTKKTYVKVANFD